MTIPLGVELEKLNALQDAQDYLFERGNDITLCINDEGSIERGLYGSIKKRTSTKLTLHAYPVIYSPTDDQLKVAGINESVDVIITLAVKDFYDNSLMSIDNNASFDTLDTTRWEIILDGNLYVIADKNLINHFSHVYLNISLGLNRK